MDQANCIMKPVKEYLLIMLKMKGEQGSSEDNQK